MKDFVSRPKYPNPLRASGIEFELPEPAEVTLSILDESGKEISQLLAARPFPAGTHEVYVDSSLYRVGVYFYRFEIRKGTAMFVDTKRLVLIR